jgi:hypothetical protein
MKEYEHEWNGMNICKRHDRRNCIDCHYISDLEQQNKAYEEALKKVLDISSSDGAGRDMRKINMIVGDLLIKSESKPERSNNS